MPPRRAQPPEKPPDLPTEKAYAILKGQLAKLQEFKGHLYQEAERAENEWVALTEKLIMRSFGSESSNYKKFRMASSAGNYFITPYVGEVNHALNQNNFLARVEAYEASLRSSITELELDLPGNEIKGVYEPGQEYEFYRDVTECLKLALKEIFVIDPYLSTEIFNVYAGAIPRTVTFRLLSANVPADVQAVAQKYAAGGNFAFRTSNSIHDRVLFADSRVWVIGQSLKTPPKKSRPISLSTTNPCIELFTKKSGKRGPQSFEASRRPKRFTSIFSLRFPCSCSIIAVAARVRPMSLAR